MRQLSGLDALDDLTPGSALTIGNFDGVHRGHRYILQTLRRLSESGPTTVVTFEPHPLSVLRPDLAPPRLTTASQKAAQLADAGVDELLVLRPDPNVLGLSAEAFWQRVRDGARPKHLAEGSNFKFGKGAAGTVRKLQEWSAGSGVSVHAIDPVDVVLPNKQIVRASSSLARWLIVQGRVRDAMSVLGHPYMLTGTVERGEARGRTIGFPTANLAIPEQLIPADGVYAAVATVDEREVTAAVSIGTNPTFDGVRRTVEAFLLDFDGDLYDRPLSLRLLDWVRGQVKFAGVGPLVEQMQHDVERIREAVVRMVA